MKFFLLISFILLAFRPTEAQINSACAITNWGNEDRTMTYRAVTSSILVSILDTGDIRRDKSIKYSTSSSINADSVYKRIIKARQSIPKSFKLSRWGFGTSERKNKPNEDGSVWFTLVLTKEEPKNNFIPYVGYTVIFEGTDPTLARVDPKVKDVVIISNKNLLKGFIAKFKALPER